MAAAVEDAGGSAGDTGGAPRSAMAARSEQDKSRDLHVKWDEESIAEQDKERGTRQKIDEPPTPFNRSPVSASDEEDEGSAPRGSSGSGPDRAGLGALDPVAVAARLAELAEAPAAESPAPSKSAADRGGEVSPEDAAGRGTKRKLSADASEGSAAGPGADPSVQGASPQASSPALMVPASPSASVVSFATSVGGGRASSASFKAKRAKHYDEYQMMAAFRAKKVSGEDSADESDGSGKANKGKA